ncbi:hypothetical protein [Streptococcus sanguinis]|uniref:Uncharacterized protein n=1 Tax=Streptococcus sanguinis TaxID=1305 RepID=A0A2X3VDA6_STRSA|nr:hypothetical protein [Streptococcus sanguinis]EGJ42900.1 hypothetical protein HMPREF9396_1578 [Streptococcus sanguinis SK1059]EGQ19502.1 hypothetical protein HMPREF8573_1568 [Streptococcus sanguinis ATCC 29667]EGQ22890.1 hypothetical protein HMPREF9387_2120 [Streptococcus sanguinis SK340]RSI24499.1 hypothetical protein D8883_04690 [Streptococcus sanguinis]SQF33819.1 Uncharacterised protein [Streptococcus sanguinis]
MNWYQKRLAVLALMFLIIGTFLSIGQIYAHQSSDKKEDDLQVLKRLPEQSTGLMQPNDIAALLLSD